MPTNYTKAEIQFWWDPKSKAIHVTTKPGTTSPPLHATFPNDEESVRWHRSFFTWLAETLRAEGKPVPAPAVGAAGRVEYPVKLRGSMWWNDPAEPGRLDEFVLRDNGGGFEVTDREDETCYRGTLRRVTACGSKFQGSLVFKGGTGSVSCELTDCGDGTYRLEGKWRQSTTAEVFDWNADLERVE